MGVRLAASERRLPAPEQVEDDQLLPDLDRPAMRLRGFACCRTRSSCIARRRDGDCGQRRSCHSIRRMIPPHGLRFPVLSTGQRYAACGGGDTTQIKARPLPRTRRSGQRLALRRWNARACTTVGRAYRQLPRAGRQRQRQKSRARSRGHGFRHGQLAGVMPQLRPSSCRRTVRPRSSATARSWTRCCPGPSSSPHRSSPCRLRADGERR